jgi:hypothetical protein
MKPTFSLSSACAAPPTIKLAAVAIANSVFFMFPALLVDTQYSKQKLLGAAFV